MPRRIKTQGSDTISHQEGINFYSVNYHASPKLYNMEKDTFDQNSIQLNSSLKISFNSIFSKCKKKSWNDNKIKLEIVRPRGAPYVPFLLKVLVLNIEMDCHTKNTNTDAWFKNYIITPSESEKALEFLQKPISNPSMSEEEIDQYIKLLPIRVQIAMMKEFLSLLSEKLLTIPVEVYTKIQRRPLYDSMYRVNPQLKGCIAQIVMRLSRLKMDTLSFMMIHILHLWEYSASPQITKVSFCDFFGPLIIGFHSKVLLPLDTVNKSAEAALLTAILDATDSRVWNNYGGGRLFTLFKFLTPFEEKRVWQDTIRVSLVIGVTKYKDFINEGEKSE